MSARDPEVARELRRMFLLNRTSFPVGTFGGGAVLVMLSWPYVAHPRLLVWGALNTAVALAWIFVLHPPLSERSDAEGLPRYAGLLGTVGGALFGAAAWLDLDALRHTPFAWVVLVVLFAMSAGSQSGTMNGTSYPVRSQVPLWSVAVAAFAVAGSWVIVAGVVLYVLIIVRDTLSSRRLVVAGVEARMAAARAAVTDHLTGLLNRAGAFAELERLHRRAIRGEPLSVRLLYVDLDLFKEVNDTRGHLVGDAVLIAVAERLRAVQAPGEVVARLGGDEFLLVTAYPPGAEDDGVAAARRVVDALQRPIPVPGGHVVISASVGVALGRGYAVNPDHLIARADAALYEAKRAGRGCVVAAA